MPPPNISHLTLPPLRRICQHLGIPSTSTKPVLLEALASVSAPNTRRTTTLSIDLGIRNLAFCHLAADSTVTKWDRLQLPLPGGSAVPRIDLPVYAEAAVWLKKTLPAADEIIIEHQRWRSGGARAVLPITIAVNTMEAMLHVTFCGTATCIEPAAIAKTWNFVGGKQRKQEKIAMVRTLLKSGAVEGSLEAWEGNRKKDDLADCLIQGLTWKRWMKNRERWVEGNFPLGLEHFAEMATGRRQRKAVTTAVSGPSVETSEKASETDAVPGSEEDTTIPIPGVPGDGQLRYDGTAELSGNLGEPCELRNFVATGTSSVPTVRRRGRPQKSAAVMTFGGFTGPTSLTVALPVRKRGRPRKPAKSMDAGTTPAVEEAVVAPLYTTLDHKDTLKLPRKRGRPRKLLKAVTRPPNDPPLESRKLPDACASQAPHIQLDTNTDLPHRAPLRRGRGRPRKMLASEYTGGRLCTVEDTVPSDGLGNIVVADVAASGVHKDLIPENGTDSSSTALADQLPQPKRRGRPRKQLAVQNPKE